MHFQVGGLVNDDFFFTIIFFESSMQLELKAAKAGQNRNQNKVVIFFPELSGTSPEVFFFQGVCRVFSFSCSLCDVCDLCPRVLVCADLDNADNATCETLQTYVAKVRRISILVFATKLKDATCPAALRSYQDVKVLPSPFKLGN